jgi:hypothetical protein
MSFLQARNFGFDRLVVRVEEFRLAVFYVKGKLAFLVEGFAVECGGGAELGGGLAWI